MENTKTTQFVVLLGTFDDASENVVVQGVFKTLDDAREFIVDEYKMYHDVDDPNDNPDLDFTTFCDDGHTFWKIQEVQVR